MPADTLGTERLRLDPFREEEAEELHALWTRPEVRRYLWDDRVVPPGQTREIVRESRALFAARGFGLWSIRERGEPALCGFGGYWHFRDPPELELILGLAPERWGKGLATEAGRALVRHGLDALGFAEVRGSTDAPNQRSRRLMERLGMRFERREVVGGLDTVFYARSSREEA
jgi:RimJ/RimL family protein N-acetyltransferase